MKSATLADSVYTGNIQAYKADNVSTLRLIDLNHNLATVEIERIEAVMMKLQLKSVNL